MIQQQIIVSNLQDLFISHYKDLLWSITLVRESKYKARGVAN